MKSMDSDSTVYEFRLYAASRPDATIDSVQSSGPRSARIALRDSQKRCGKDRHYGTSQFIATVSLLSTQREISGHIPCGNGMVFM